MIREEQSVVMWDEGLNGIAYSVVPGVA